MAYHYTESGLQNVYLQNGYSITETPYGKAVSIVDVQGLHRVIGQTLAHKSHLTGAELRFLRKEIGFSQRMLADILGCTEQNVSLWERRGRMPKTPERLVKVLYLEKTQGDVRVEELLQELCELDRHIEERLQFEAAGGSWKVA